MKKILITFMTVFLLVTNCNAATYNSFFKNGKIEGTLPKDTVFANEVISRGSVFFFENDGIVNFAYAGKKKLITMYSPKLYKGKQLVKLDKTVTVHLPVPSSYAKKELMFLGVNSEGQYMDTPYSIKNNHFVFETDELYPFYIVMIETVDYNNKLPLPNATGSYLDQLNSGGTTTTGPVVTETPGSSGTEEVTTPTETGTSTDDSSNPVETTTTTKEETSNNNTIMFGLLGLGAIFMAAGIIFLNKKNLLKK